MKLIDLVESIREVDDELIIFQENKDSFDSDIILSNGNGEIVEEYNGKKYYYLIEVFLAKEFIEDWVSSLNYSPSQNEIAERLFKYAINDA